MSSEYEVRFMDQQASTDCRPRCEARAVLDLYVSGSWSRTKNAIDRLRGVTDLPPQYLEVIEELALRNNQVTGCPLDGQNGRRGSDWVRDFIATNRRAS